MNFSRLVTVFTKNNRLVLIMAAVGVDLPFVTCLVDIHIWQSLFIIVTGQVYCWAWYIVALALSLLHHQGYHHPHFEALRS
jgi:hypothetical protein